MSIVAHQYNILSEQLRRGLGGLNQAKVQASQAALEMEKLKYGIARDEREDKRAEARLGLEREAGERAERQTILAEQRGAREETEFKQDAYKRKIQDQLMKTPATLENIREAVDPAHTMNEERFKKYATQALKLTGATNMAEVKGDNTFMVIIGQASDDEHMDNTISKLEHEIGQTELETQGFRELHWEEIEKAKSELATLKAAKADPLGSAIKKLEVYENYFGGIRDPEQRQAAEFIIEGHRNKVKALAEAALKQGQDTRVETVYSRDPITEEISSRQVKLGKDEPYTPKEGETLHKPPEKKSKYFDPSDKVSLQEEIDKLQKLATAYRTSGGLEGLNQMAYTDTQLKGFADDPEAIEIRKEVDARIDRLKQLKSLPDRMNIDHGTGEKTVITVDLKTIAKLAKLREESIEETEDWLIRLHTAQTELTVF